MQSLVMSGFYGIPAFDGDLMGRAYPKLNQVLPGASRYPRHILRNLKMLCSRVRSAQCVWSLANLCLHRNIVERLVPSALCDGDGNVVVSGTLYRFRG
jgi:hypothetical protein